LHFSETKPIFTQEKLVVLSNAFVKKSMKIPRKEIQKTQRIKKEYENEIK